MSPSKRVPYDDYGERLYEAEHGLGTGESLEEKFDRSENPVDLRVERYLAAFRRKKVKVLYSKLSEAEKSRLLSDFPLWNLWDRPTRRETRTRPRPRLRRATWNRL